MPRCRHTLLRLIPVFVLPSLGRVFRGRPSTPVIAVTTPCKSETLTAVVRESSPVWPSNPYSKKMKVIPSTRSDGASGMDFARRQNWIIASTPVLKQVYADGCFAGYRVKSYRPFLCRDYRADGACRGEGRPTPLCFSKCSSTPFPMNKRYPKLRRISVINRKTDLLCSVSRASHRSVIFSRSPWAGIAEVFDSEIFSTSI